MWCIEGVWVVVTYLVRGAELAPEHIEVVAVADGLWCVCGGGGLVCVREEKACVVCVFSVLVGRGGWGGVRSGLVVVWRSRRGWSAVMMISTCMGMCS